MTEYFAELGVTLKGLALSFMGALLQLTFHKKTPWHLLMLYVLISTAVASLAGAELAALWFDKKIAEVIGPVSVGAGSVMLLLSVLRGFEWIGENWGKIFESVASRFLGSKRTGDDDVAS